MNIAKIKQVEKEFLKRYPEGFNDPDIQNIRKKHNLDKHTAYIHDVCSLENLKKGVSVFDDVVKVVTRSSLVSVFEKMRFRDFAKEIDQITKLEIVHAVTELIHGSIEDGFNHLVSILEPYKLAKWPIITIFRTYYFPQEDVFVKPTVVKKILSFLEITTIIYTSKVNYEFYKEYKILFNEMKHHVSNESLKRSNPGFSGMFMMVLG